MRSTPLFVLLAALSLPGAACGTSSGPPQGLIAELDALARGPNRAFALSTALVAPGTLLLTGTDDNLLNAVDIRLSSETSDCAKRAQVPGMLSVSFASSSGNGCVLATSGVTVSGSMQLTIARDGSVARIIAKLDLVMEGEPLTGELVVVTSNGTTFTYTTLAALSGHTFNIPMLTGQPIDRATAVTGTGTTPGTGTTMRQLKYANLTQRFQACHARVGTIELISASEGIDRTLSFADNTPQDGVATFTDNGVVTTVTLPSVPSCPPLPTPAS